MSLRKRLIVVGDGACGKTCLLYAFARDEFIPDHVPTVFETSSIDFEVDSTMVELIVTDTAGQEEYEALRAVCFNEDDVVLICYSVEERSSFENVKESWINEVRHHLPKTPIILVANKKDLREDEHIDKSQKQLITTEEGLAMSKTIKAKGFFECSAKTREGVKEVFEAAIRASIAFSPHSRNSKKSQKKCSIQ